MRDIRSSGGFAPAIAITAGAGADLEKQLDDDTTLLHKPFQIAEFSELAGNVLASRHRQERQT